MSNLDIEGLSKTIQTGDTQSFFGSGISIGNGGGSVSEARVTKEMEQQGMSVNAPSADGTTFSQILRDSFDKVNEAQHQADSAIKELVAGRTKNIHETMLTIEKADTSLKLAMQVRNKILDAYKEIMHMQV